jgi:hypothetical protein
MSVGEIAFMTLLFLSVLWIIALGVCWVFVAPESDDWDITKGGNKLRRAKYFFTSAGGLIVVTLLLDLFVSNPKGSNTDFWLWSEHPHILVFFLVLSSVLSIVATYHELNSKGNGRWVLQLGAPGMAVLSILGAICVGQSI